MQIPKLNFESKKMSIERIKQLLPNVNAEFKTMEQVVQENIPVQVVNWERFIYEYKLGDKVFYCNGYQRYCEIPKNCIAHPIQRCKNFVERLPQTDIMSDIWKFIKDGEDPKTHAFERFLESEKKIEEVLEKFVQDPIHVSTNNTLVNAVLKELKIPRVKCDYSYVYKL